MPRLRCLKLCKSKTEKQKTAQAQLKQRHINQERAQVKHTRLFTSLYGSTHKQLMTGPKQIRESFCAQTVHSQSKKASVFLDPSTAVTAQICPSDSLQIADKIWLSKCVHLACFTSVDKTSQHFSVFRGDKMGWSRRGRERRRKNDSFKHTIIYKPLILGSNLQTFKLYTCRE